MIAKLIRWSIYRGEVVTAAGSIGLLLLYAGLVWEERASKVTEDPAPEGV